MPSYKQTFCLLIHIISHHCRLTYRYFTINMQKCKLVFWITWCLYYSCKGWKFWGLNSRMVVSGVMIWWGPWHMLIKGYEMWVSCTLLGNLVPNNFNFMNTSVPAAFSRMSSNKGLNEKLNISGWNFNEQCVCECACAFFKLRCNSHSDLFPSEL
jgi:hypothetical protein